MKKIFIAFMMFNVSLLFTGCKSKYREEGLITGNGTYHD